MKQICSKCKQQGHITKYCKVGFQTSQAVSQSSQFTDQSSQGSSNPEQRSSCQSGLKRFNQSASTKSSNHGSSTKVCGDTTRVGRVRETPNSTQPQPFLDTSQLPPRRRESAGPKRARV
ncbi:hypothetical protein KY284_005398 [Solanum tuberosum]|nr:hypothetical protein KY284_005398 [Solanum tuberosum]